MRIVAQQYPTYGIALGDIISLPKWLVARDRWIIKHIHGSVVIRPISLLPGVRFRIIRQIAYIFTSIILHQHIENTYRGAKKYLWFFEPFHMPILLPVFKRYISLYDCVDYFPGFSPQAKREHALLIKRVRHVFANSGPLAHELKKDRQDVITVPLGFASDVFKKIPLQPLRPNKHSLVIGFVGSISDRIDFSLLQKAIAILPKVQFVFVGAIETHIYGAPDRTEVQFKQLLQNPNVRWRKEVPKAQIPRVVASFDIGIIPYRADSSFNRLSFPMKTLEYFALGKPVIATDILALRPYNQHGLLRIISKPKDFVQVVKDIQKLGWNTSMQKKQYTEAEHMSWKRKVTAILTNNTEAFSGVSPRHL